MGRAKKTSANLDLAVTRLTNLKSISPTLDLGNGLTVPTYEAMVVDVRTKLDDYNMTLSLVDEKLNIVQAAEKKLGDLSVRMLSGVATKFTNDSNEYEKAGGVRKSERKKPKKRAPKKS